jgi:hypothetical protein
VSESTNHWSTNQDVPEVVNTKQSVFSVDVLVYFKQLDEHTIGFYEYSTGRWLFLSKQDYQEKEFEWRYFRNETDKNNFEL